jgi:excisionase family DNA binding protein
MDCVTSIRPNSVYTFPTVAEDLGISVRTLQRAVQAGKLDAVRAGYRTFVVGRALLSWLRGDYKKSRRRKRKPK